MRRNQIITLLTIVALFLGTNGFAQDPKSTEAGDTANKTAEHSKINAFMVEKIIGFKVINMKGVPIGKIENLVLDIDTGKILYAVLESGGFLTIGDKLIPVPWESLAALPSEGIFFLNQTKEQMEKAPAFDKNNLPNIEDLNWGEGIFMYYGLRGYEPRGPMGYSNGVYDEQYGHPMHPGPWREIPYGNIFDSKTIKVFSGQVIKADPVSEPGFYTEIRLTVFIDNKEVLPVYLGPDFYIQGSDYANKFKIGDKVTVTGSLVTGHGEPFLLATTVKRGNKVLRLRDNDGTPEWLGWKTLSD